MKNITVNMPLAVPHQRPPSKYASHPYPVLIDDTLLIPSVAIIAAELRTVIVTLNESSKYSANVTPLDIEVKTTLFYRTVNDPSSVIGFIEPLDITTKSALINNFQYDKSANTASIAPLDFNVKSSLIYYFGYEKQATAASITPLDIMIN